MKHPRHPGDLRNCSCDECNQFRADQSRNRSVESLGRPVGAPPNLNLRRATAETLIGQAVQVYKLGSVRPQDDPNTDVYLPLPEYGIALVTYKPREYSHGEAMAKMLPAQGGWYDPDNGQWVSASSEMREAIHKAGNV